MSLIYKAVGARLIIHGKGKMVLGLVRQLHGLRWLISHSYQHPRAHVSNKSAGMRHYGSGRAYTGQGELLAAVIIPSSLTSTGRWLSPPDTNPLWHLSFQLFVTA